MVHREGLEPSRLGAPDSDSGMSAIPSSVHMAEWERLERSGADLCAASLAGRCLTN